MAIARDIAEQLRHMLRPIATRVANSIARGVVQLVDDSTKLQLVQLGILAEETVDAGEHFQPYGLSSVPLPGAEHVTLFPGGDRAHPIVIVVSDRRYRPTGGDPGLVALYNHVGARVLLLPDGTVEIRSASGAATKLPTLADYEALRVGFNSHIHAVATTGTAAAQTGTAAAVASPVSSPAGTTVLKAE